MKNLKKVLAILIAILMFSSVLTGCAKEDSSKTTTPVSIITTTKLETTTESETTHIKGETPAESKSNPEVGKIIQFGSYEQDNDLSNGKEKIDWRVLAVENGKALLLSEKILDTKPYNDKIEDVTWETCTLRKWLNNDFYSTAFSSSEQLRIVTNIVVNSDTPDNGNLGGNDTSDKLFLLSYAEVINSAFGFSSSTDVDSAREA